MDDEQRQVDDHHQHRRRLRREIDGHALGRQARHGHLLDRQERPVAGAERRPGRCIRRGLDRRVMVVVTGEFGRTLVSHVDLFPTILELAGASK